ncbi:MAG TPA: methyltransferase type 11 [Gammaproteobacteria bacterium]|jgi:uncharacterized membrane protein YkvA (DUF1232 family)|nr:MAG: DUF1232 domain-containing protein [OM182 bacterium]HAL41627.1 methyltransferase type 11 [Gammaproteobacteria bacterium]HBK18387.1 methyltransferase type 11 [Gammaproteobacteria bacterium]|tara:strand:- start:13576 stop:13998 length:423 start_codon:yes stop_codon:yes gene_type:complete
MDKPPRGLKRYRGRGARLLGSPGELKRVLSAAAEKLKQTTSTKIGEVREQLQLLIELLQVYASGEYRDVSKETMITVAAAVIYFLVPLDVVPDFLLGWGLVDDAAIISYVLSQISDELDAFKQWRAQRTDSPKTDGDETP